ncbi:MAG: hypothetical protein ACD_15C00237G0009 [uncultured bacterium]|nr:MAG: hypothetical protein ACD_15C00237G0009 [uncultured bacterium]
MAESFKSKRVEFQPERQKEFIEQSKVELGLTWNELSKIAKTSTRNLTDWKNEKILMSLVAVENICKRRSIYFPKNVTIKDPYWYVQKGAAAGGKATYKKYGIIGGDQDSRKERWFEWWEKEGKFKVNGISNPLPFKKPKFSKKLAEFVGIMLGDGGMTSYQAKITLHCKDDLEYSCFVEKLITKLFNLKPSKKFRNDCNALNIVMSRVELVKFLIEKVGLSIGNKVKHQVDIPDWIKNSEEFAIACVRGLIDTDGCIYDHAYMSKGKLYNYKKLQFTNMSKPLAHSVYKILNDNGLRAGLYFERDVRVENKKDVDRYFKIFKTHNTKHLNRYNK